MFSSDNTEGSSRAVAAVAEPARRFALAVAGLVLSLISPLFWALSLDVNFLQRSGLAMWLAMFAGLAGAVAAARRDRRLRTRVAAVVAGLWTSFCIAGFVFVSRLPPATAVGSTDRVVHVVLADHTGQPVSLDRLLRDGPVLLVFYRGHWWLSCRAELRGLGAINDELANKGVKLLAVSVDPPWRSRKVVEADDLPFPILADEQRALTRGFGLLHPGAGPGGSDIALPAHVLIDGENRIRWIYVSDRIQNRLREDQVLGHVSAALAKEPM